MKLPQTAIKSFLKLFRNLQGSSDRKGLWDLVGNHVTRIPARSPRFPAKIWKRALHQAAEQHAQDGKDELETPSVHQHDIFEEIPRL